MSAGRIAVIVAAAIALAAVSVPTPASAVRGQYVIPAGSVTRAHLHGSHGYRIGVTENSRGFVVLQTTKGGAKTQYATHGRSGSGDEIDAKLPGFGSASVAFTPRGRPRQLASYSNCDGGPTVQKGIVRGRIRFRGERGYTDADVSRAEAEVLRWPRLRCRFLKGPPREPRLAGVFSAFAFRPYVEFSAIKYPTGDRPAARRIVFTATAASFGENLVVYRSVSIATGVESFVTPDSDNIPENITLTPPGPYFRGSASFRRTPESTFSWEGDLKVSFPGTGALRLTGPDFETRYCALAGCAAQYGDEAPIFRRAAGRR